MFFLRSVLAVLAFAFAAAIPSAQALDLFPRRESRYDLWVAGRLEGVALGQSRYLTHSELQALPGASLELGDEFVHGHRDLSGGSDEGPYEDYVLL